MPKLSGLLSSTNVLFTDNSSSVTNKTIDGEQNTFVNIGVPLELRTPVVTSPTDGQTGVQRAPVIEASSYAPLYDVDTRDYRQFQVDVAAGNFSNPVLDVQLDADSYTISPALDFGTSYKVRVRDVSDDGLLSNWSETVSFSVLPVTINAPTLDVTGEPNSVPETPTLTGGAFGTEPVGEDTHVSTDWQVLEGATVVYESLSDSVNLTSISIPEGFLEVNTEYTFRLRYNGAVYGSSTYTEVVATTLETFEVVPLLAVAHTTTPFVTIYNQEVDTFTKLPDPSSLPTGNCWSVAFSSDDIYMAVGNTISPFIVIYKRDVDVFTKLANPSTLPASTSYGVAFSSDDTYMAVAHNISPYITIYKRSADTFTKLANPSTLPASTSYGVAFSSDDTYMAVAHASTPFITIYKRSGDTFTKLANPSTLPASTARDVAFSSDDTYLAVAHTSSPYVTIYKRSGDTFTKLTNPSLPAGNAQGVAFSSDDTYMAVVGSVSPYLTIYKRSGDTFTKLSPVSITPTGVGLGVAFSNDSVYMSVAHFSSPYITIYKRSGDTFTKLANPAVLPTGLGLGVAFSNTGFPQ